MALVNKEKMEQAVKEACATANRAATCTPILIEFHPAAATAEAPKVFQLQVGQQQWLDEVVAIVCCLLGTPEFRTATLQPLYVALTLHASVSKDLVLADLDGKMVAQLKRRSFRVNCDCSPANWMEVDVPIAAFQSDPEAAEATSAFPLRVNATWLSMIEEVFTGAAAAADPSQPAAGASSSAPRPAHLKQLHIALGVIKLTHEIVHTLTPHMAHVMHEAAKKLAAGSDVEIAK